MARMFKAHRAAPTRHRNRPADPAAEAKSPVQADPTATLSESAGSARGGQRESRPKEIGGPSGPEPTRYGDWERNGICVDF